MGDDTQFQSGHDFHSWELGGTTRRRVEVLPFQSGHDLSVVVTGNPDGKTRHVWTASIWPRFSVVVTACGRRIATDSVVKVLCSSKAL